MKKILRTTIVLVLFYWLAACEMDFYPADNIEQSQSFETAEDLGTWVDGCYATLRGGVYGTYTMPFDIQCDLFNATSSYGNNYGAIHSWTQINASTYQLEYPWEKYYNLIANLNNVITNYPNITPDDDELSEFNTYVGEAYFMRAFAYAYLLDIYAQAYDASSASSDLGVPLNLTYDIEAKLARSSIQEVYDQIFEDLDAAEDYWSGIDFSSVTEYNGSPSRFTDDAITALKARLYLRMEDWDNAITEAEKIIGSGDFPLVTTEDDYTSMWMDDQSSEIITHFYIDDDESSNTNSYYLMTYNTSTDSYTNYYIPEQWVLDLYDDDDYRKSVFFANFTLILSTGTFTDIYSFNKYPLTTLWTSSGSYKHAPIIFRTAEMYLIVAEAGARGSQDELALQRLNELRAARGLSELTGLSDDELFDEVKDERVREMIGEGTRLMDLKRWDMGFTRSETQNDDACTTTHIDLTVEAGDDFFVWGIPSYDMSLNDNLVQNPGY